MAKQNVVKKINVQKIKVQNNFGSETILSPKKFEYKNLWLKQLVKKIQMKKNVLSKKIWARKCLDQEKFGPKRMMVKN